MQTNCVGILEADLPWFQFHGFAYGPEVCLIGKCHDSQDQRADSNLTGYFVPKESTSLHNSVRNQEDDFSKQFALKRLCEIGPCSLTGAPTPAKTS